MVLALTTAFVACAPTWYGAAQTPPGFLFLWNPDPWDNDTYFAKMRSGYEGSWRLTNLYTSEPHPPVALYPFHLALGHLARGYGAYQEWRTGIRPPARESLVVAYELARFELTFGLSLLIYWLTGHVTRRPARRLWTVAICTFAGGVGHGASFTEAHVLSSCIHYAHFVAALVLYVLAIGLFLGCLGRARIGAAANAGLAALVGSALAWVHPYDLPALCAVGATALLVEWAATRRLPWRLGVVLSGFGVGAAVSALPQLALRRLPAFESQFVQTRAVLDWDVWWRPEQMLGSYLAVALLGLIPLWWKRRRPWARFLAAWLVAGLTVVHLPVTFQRRAIEGLPILLGLLVALAVDGLAVRPLVRLVLERFGRRRRLVLVVVRHAPYAVVLALLLPHTIGVVRDNSVGLYGRVNARAPYGAPYAYHYMRPAEVRAVDWLAGHAGATDVVWAPPLHGNVLPFVAGTRVFFGHSIETIDWVRKRDWTVALFSRQLDVATFRRLVEKHDIGYLYAAPEVTVPRYRGMRGFDDTTLGSPVFDDGEVQIYRLARTDPRGGVERSDQRSTSSRHSTK